MEVDILLAYTYLGLHIHNALEMIVNPLVSYLDYSFVNFISLFFEDAFGRTSILDFEFIDNLINGKNSPNIAIIFDSGTIESTVVYHKGYVYCRHNTYYLPLQFYGLIFVDYLSTFDIVSDISYTFRLTEIMEYLILTSTPAVALMTAIYFTVLFFFAIYFIFFCIGRTFLHDESSFDDSFNSIFFLIESEKEIGSLDDITLPACIFICIYGWFFSATSLYFVFVNTEITYMFVGFPILLFIIFSMPASVIFDCGIMFSSYLRGVGNSTILLLELLYDTLATLIMFVRLSVQNVRFFLMFVAYLEIYELIANASIIQPEFFSSNDSFYSQVQNVFNLNNYLYSNLVNFFIFTLRWLYQLAHLIFVITSHFIAYFALVFWLFSFLYTSFFDERLEQFFLQKRQLEKSKPLVNFLKLNRKTT